MTKRCAFLVATSAAVIASTSPAVAAPAINLLTPGLEYSGSPYTLGFEFSVSSAQSVSALGVYDNLGNGLTAPAQIGIWSTGGTLLTSTTIVAGGGTLNGLFRYASITPFALTAGTHYIVGAYTTDLASSLGTGQSGTGNVNPLVTVYTDRYVNSSSFSFPSTTNSFAGGAWLGANFDFGAAAAVPEPATWAMMLLGFGAIGVALRRPRQQATVTFA